MHNVISVEERLQFYDFLGLEDKLEIANVHLGLLVTDAQDDERLFVFVDQSIFVLILEGDALDLQLVGIGKGRIDG